MRFYVKVVPKSSRERIEKISDGNYKAWVGAAPEKGKANQRLVEILADYFGTGKNNIQIISGKTSRVKLVEVTIVN